MAEEHSDLSHVPAEELKFLARQHMDAFFKEIRGVRGDVRKRLHPVSLVRRHPWAALVLGGVVGLMIVRFLRRRMASASGSASAQAKPESVARTFRRSLAAGAAQAAGRALPNMLFPLVLRRLARGRRGVRK